MQLSNIALHCIYGNSHAPLEQAPSMSRNSDITAFPIVSYNRQHATYNQQAALRHIPAPLTTPLCLSLPLEFFYHTGAGTNIFYCSIDFFFVHLPSSPHASSPAIPELCVQAGPND